MSQPAPRRQVTASLDLEIAIRPGEHQIKIDMRELVHFPLKLLDPSLAAVRLSVPG
jgi:hypothetical protein